MTRDDTLALLRRFCEAHSPTGCEREIDPLIRAAFAERGYTAQHDAAGNLFAVRPGRGAGRTVVTAHKDEIGVIVKRIEHDGRLQVRRVGGSFPWVYGEGPMDVLGDDEVVTGILSFGARHTSPESPHYAARTQVLEWEHAWIETFMDPGELDDAGVHVGSKAVVARHRKAPVVMRDHIAAYGLDDKAALVVLFDILEQLEDAPTESEVVFAVTAAEEIGVAGAAWLTARYPADVMIAIEVAPVADEYHTVCDARPVILMQDSHMVYDERVARELTTAAGNLELGVQYACVSGFGSDASITCRAGHTARPAAVGFATENTHGFEIAHLGGILNTARLVAEYLRSFA